MAKEGSTVSGLMDTMATMTSISLQYGVPLRDLVNKFAHVRFEPAGFTGNSEIPIAKSIVDYVFRWLGSRFLSKDERDALGIISREDAGTGLSETSAPSAAASLLRQGADRPPESESPAAGTTPSPTTETHADLGEQADNSRIGGAGGPKAQANAVEPPPTDSVGGTDLPVHSNGHANGHANGGAGSGLGSIKPLDLGGGTKVAFSVSADSPSCADCGSIMVRNGSCYKCLNCGSTSGCS